MGRSSGVRKVQEQHRGWASRLAKGRRLGGDRQNERGSRCGRPSRRHYSIGCYLRRLLTRTRPRKRVVEGTRYDCELHALVARVRNFWPYKVYSRLVGRKSKT